MGMVKKGKPEKRNLLTTSENNVIKSNYVKAKIDNIYLWSDRIEKANPIKSECIKLFQIKSSLGTTGRERIFEIVQKITLWPDGKMASAQARFSVRKWHTKFSGIWYVNGSLNLEQKISPTINKKKNTCNLVDFVDGKMNQKIRKRQTNSWILQESWKSDGK